MKKLLKYFALSVMITLMLGNVSIVLGQQQQPRPPMVPDDDQISHMVDEMAQELSLTKTQQEQITELHKQHFTEVKQLMEKGKSQHEQMKAMHDNLRKEFENKMRSVMEEDQLQKFDSFMQKLEARHDQQMRQEGKPMQQREN